MSPDTLGLQIRRQKGKTVDAQIAEYWSVIRLFPSPLTPLCKVSKGTVLFVIFVNLRKP